MSPSRILRLLLAAATCSLVACAQADAPSTQSGVDAGESDASDSDAQGSDGGVSDADGTDSGGGDDIVEEDSGPELGGFGDPCLENEDCASDYCIEGAEGEPICTILCSGECPDPAYECRLVENSGGDLVQVCFPVLEELCQECITDNDCSGLANECVDLIDGSFCGRDCSTDGLCPDGYVCQDVLGGGEQCVPESGQCSACIDEDGDLRGDGAFCMGFDCDDTNNRVYQDAPELCDGIDNDCDGLRDEDFDTDSDVRHCGACNEPCELPNATPGCSGGVCFVTGCEEQYYDLNGDPSDGCEYYCEFEDFEVEDRPDPEFRDTNCDGIDGDPFEAIFVAPTGDDTNPGTQDAPMRTIPAAMARAVSLETVSSVYVGAGEYRVPSGEPGVFQPLELVNGISLYGSYDAENWSRSADNVTLILGSNPAVIATSIDQPTDFAGFSVQGNSARQLRDGRGDNAIGMLVINSTALRIVSSTVRAGDGADGANGGSGGTGDNGSPGEPGNDGPPDSSGVCPSNSAPSVGIGGTSSCSSGGNGGAAARSENRGGNGRPEPPGGSVTTLPGFGGVGGRGGDNDFFGGASRDGEDGTDGTNGANGGDGAPGAPGIAIMTLDGDFARAGNGGDGVDGDNGQGGGGGGGGGGATGSFGGITSSCDGYGGSGGGGGGAGCGGDGGDGGSAGGGSFALYLIDSPITVRLSNLEGGEAGSGGNGGDGGAGGSGGAGREGGDSGGNGGSGGRGGNGGRGGRGGQGGGGAGGSSFGGVLVRSTGAVFEETVLTFRAAGNGGAGGAAGDDGTAGELLEFD